MRLDYSGRWQVASEHVCHRLIPDEGKLDTEAYYDANHKSHDKELEQSQTPHGSVGSVEYQKEEDICQGDSASRHEWDV